MWSGAPTGSEPDATAKYRFALTGTSQVADRPAQEVVVRRRGTSAPSEILYFDRDTGMLLRRDDLDGQGRLARRFAFVQMSAPASAHATTPGDVPSSPRPDAPHALARVPSDLRAPKMVGRGFKLSGAYSQPDGSVQLYYSDGLFGLSVFERQGELDSGALPTGGRTEHIGGVHAHVYRTVAGTAVVWGNDEVTYTCVTDAPVAEVAAVTSSLAPSSSSAMEDVGRFVTAPFSWG
jgi:negative regulator of sigma E activity